jgi:hypothetical protein
VNTLVKELENKESILVCQPNIHSSTNQRPNTAHYESLNASISLSSLKENLTKFQHKLKNHHREKMTTEPRIKVVNSLIETSNELTTSTSSDTLIDADSSFYSLKIDPMRRQTTNNVFRNLSTKSFQLPHQKIETKDFLEDKNQLLLQEKFNLNNLKLHQQKTLLKRSKLDDDIEELSNAIVANQINQSINNLEDDEDEENEKIIIAMEELSISTMQTTADSTSSSSSSNTTITVENNTIFSMKSEEDEDEDDFQENLKKLDAKIFNVKQMLHSMKAK